MPSKFITFYDHCLEVSMRRLLLSLWVTEDYEMKLKYHIKFMSANYLAKCILQRVDTSDECQCISERIRTAVRY